MKDVFIPKWALEKWLPREPCKGCGEISRPVLLHLPKITIGPVMDDLFLHGECVLCRTPVYANVRIPRLKLGYILLMACEAQMRLFPGNDRHVVVDAGRMEVPDRIGPAYQQLLEQTVTDVEELKRNDEWDALSNDPAAMAEFLRRLGLTETDKDKPPF